jgi:hypothetical protein
MEWNEHFETVFFKTWQKAGLPFHQDYVAEYIETRERVDFKNEWTRQPHENVPALEPNLLRSVYGFGALIGKVYSEMLELSEDETISTRDWCGRFNLGISLFDYLCDETDGGIDTVTSLKVFQPFIKTKYLENYDIRPVEDYLSNLTESVLNDLKKDTFQETDDITKLLKQLFEAQYFLSKTELTSATNLNSIKKALQLKSAGPFNVMAKYTAYMKDINGQLLLENTHEIGKAIGNCYWLIDDAKDVWIDLEAGQWNLFFHIAVLEDPLIFTKDRNASLRKRLTTIWKQSNQAETISNHIIDSLVVSTRKLELSKKVEQHTLGLISASLWQWYKY